MNRLLVSRIKPAGKEVVVVYDMDDRRLLGELSDYAYWMLQRDLAPSTISQEINHLKIFWEYLVANGVLLEDLFNAH